MAGEYQLRLQPPLGGVNRRMAFQDQPPYTSLYTMNVAPTDPQIGRRVVSTRPVFRPMLDDALSNFSANMIEPINGVASGKPLQSLLTCMAGSYRWFDGTTFQYATGSKASSGDTGVPLFARAFLQEVIIPKSSSKPHVFDYVAGTVETMVETYGTAPTGCTMFQVWQGALWGAGTPSTPHILYGSRIGDAHDWNYGAPLSDEGGAFYTAGEDEGRLRGAITAIMPQTEDTMIVSTLEGLVAMRGHPRMGGVFEDIAGPYVHGQGAWCKTPNNTLYFMTSLGVMKLEPESGVPALVSTGSLPNVYGLGGMVGIPYNYFSPTVTMGYEPRWDAIIIRIRGTDRPENDYGWWLDVETGGFFPMVTEHVTGGTNWGQFTDGYAPMSTCIYQPAISGRTGGLISAGESGIRLLLDPYWEEE